MARWQEVEQAERENRHEIVLCGSEISERIEKYGLDNSIFKLINLNFLEITKTCLTAIPDEIAQLSNLTNLVMCLNKVTVVSPSIGKLQKLKLLNLSRNELESIPDEIGQMKSIQSLNITGNKVTDFPDISGMTFLHHLDISYNELETLPAGLPSAELVHLAEIKANNNQLKELPEELGTLPALKVFDVSENALTELPPDMCECMKMKELHFTGNKLKDRKLGRMGEQGKIKPIFDYLHGILQKERQGGGKGGKGGKKSKGKRRKKSVSEDLSLNLVRVLHFDDDDESGLTIKAMPAVQTVRPYIIACIVRHLNFHKTKNMYKRFISLQTKLHETVCNKRQAATIATHDLASVKAPLAYETRNPTTMMVRPLFKSKDVSAEKLVCKLRQEAEELRKEKKRNTISGIHKYLDLLKGKTEYPCLVDSEGEIISFPPITNCDKTKMSRDTTDLLVEVTSTASLDTCKKVMQELLTAMLEMGIGQAGPVTHPVTGDSDDDEVQGAAGGDSMGQEMALTQDQCLVVEQVKVTNDEGSLKVLYPSRVDLVSEAFRIERQ